MLKATSLIRAQAWSEHDAIARVTLTFDERYRRRIRMTDDRGIDFLLDLPEATRIEDGDGLILESNETILVRAAAEDVLDIICHDAAATARVAWHLGNRHTPVQILGSGALRIAYDHVLAHMVEHLGAHTQRRQAPFAPEPGAYSDGGQERQSHSPLHSHGEGNVHGHNHG